MHFKLVDLYIYILTIIVKIFKYSSQKSWVKAIDSVLKRENNCIVQIEILKSK